MSKGRQVGLCQNLEWQSGLNAGEMKLKEKMKQPKSYIQKFQGGLCEGVTIQMTVLERQLGSKGGGIRKPMWTQCK